MTKPHPLERTQRLDLDSQLKFNHPLYCDRGEFYQILDCYSGDPKGNWRITPKLLAPLRQYIACSKVLDAHPEHETVGEYLLATINATDSVMSSLLEVMLIRDE